MPVDNHRRPPTGVFGERVASIESIIRRLGGVAAAQELATAGVSSHALRWAVRKGRVTAIRRGVYAERGDWERADEQRRHRLELLAHQRTSPGLIASSTSAAVILGLPTPTGPPPLPILTAARPPAAGARGRGARSGRVTRQARLRPDEIWSLRHGLRVTSPLRTVLDCAREWPRPWGLAIADAAVRHGTVTAGSLLAAARRQAPMPGGAAALWVAEHAREAIESPLESVARAHIVLGGFPEPTPQVRIRTRLGVFRVDLLDQAHRLITEADGRVKYDTAADLWDEKRREDALRERRYNFARFTMADDRQPAPWLSAYRRALQFAR